VKAIATKFIFRARKKPRIIFYGFKITEEEKVNIKYTNAKNAKATILVVQTQKQERRLKGLGVEFKTIIVNSIDKLIIKEKAMDAQQLLDNIIKPTLEYMGGNYASKNASMLLLATAAIESKCGYYIKQVGGPALGIWQMEPLTHDDIWSECDALYDDLGEEITNLTLDCDIGAVSSCLVHSPKYACAMARLKYSMDPKPLPDYNNIRQVYDYYKRIYNTPLGASTYEKFKQAWLYHKLNEIML